MLLNILFYHFMQNTTEKMIEAQWITICRLKAICMPKITVNEEYILNIARILFPKMYAFSFKNKFMQLLLFIK